MIFSRKKPPKKKYVQKKKVWVFEIFFRLKTRPVWQYFSLIGKRVRRGKKNEFSRNAPQKKNNMSKKCFWAFWHRSVKKKPPPGMAIWLNPKIGAHRPSEFCRERQKTSCPKKKKVQVLFGGFDSGVKKNPHPICNIPF